MQCVHILRAAVGGICIPRGCCPSACWFGLSGVLHIMATAILLRPFCPISISNGMTVLGCLLDLSCVGRGQVASITLIRLLCTHLRRASCTSLYLYACVQRWGCFQTPSLTAFNGCIPPACMCTQTAVQQTPYTKLGDTVPNLGAFDYAHILCMMHAGSVCLCAGCGVCSCHVASALKGNKLSQSCNLAHLYAA